MEIIEPSLSVIIRVIMKPWRSAKRIMIIELDMIIVEMSILDGIVSHFYSLSFLESQHLCIQYRYQQSTVGMRTEMEIFHNNPPEKL